VVDAVCTAAEGLGVAPIDVAIAWVRDRTGVASVLLGSRTAAQLRGALRSEELTLPEEIRIALDEVSVGD
jgi:aryl-alcohol dehydrogenase-like predicted oxidoreductase